jgi:parallel beta-helix repeat protein
MKTLMRNKLKSKFIALTFFLMVFLIMNLNFGNYLSKNDDNNITQSDFNSDHYMRIKSSLGNVTLEWNFTWGESNVDRGYGIAVDSLDNIYITGSKWGGISGDDLVLIKYDSIGNQVWNTTWDDNAYEEGHDIIIDSSNNIYIAGKISNDLLLIKFNSSGDVQWYRKWDFDSYEDWANGIAIDTLNNIYIVGRVGNDTTQDADLIIVKYDNNGTELWNRTWGGANTDVAYAVTVDSSNDVYVTGETWSYGAGMNDILLIKYNSSGDLLWNLTWGVVANDGGYDIALDSAENIIITGFSDKYNNAFIIKFNQSGAEIWENYWQGFYNYSSARGIVLDSYDNIYISGICYSPIFDFFTLKFNSSGALAWYREEGGPEIDRGEKIALDSSFNVYVVGTTESYGVGSSDLWLLKYSQKPASFNLTSDADTPDNDGEFNLYWNNSIGADNYTVYTHNKTITEINSTVTEVINGLTNNSYFISGKNNGTYYYVIVAFNEYGNITSNCIKINVSIIPNLRIFISGNQGWIDFKNEGNCTGSGTYTDPYIIENLTIDGLGSESGIFIENSDVFFIIRNSTIFNSGVSEQPPIYDSGILLKSVANAQILNNTCYNNQFGILIYDSKTNITISGNKVNNNSRSGIVDNGFCDNIVISDNIANFNGDRGIYLRETSYAIVANNTASYNGQSTYRQGIQVVNCSYSIVINNIANNNSKTGIDINWESYKINVTENVVNNNDFGIIIDNDCYNITILNNNGTNNLEGLRIESNSHYNKIIGNNFSANKDIGINLYNSNYNIILGNSLKSNGFGTNERDGIVLEGDGNILTRNSIINNTERGIWLKGDFNIILGNNISNNGQYGIFSTNINNTIYNNTFIGNGINAFDNGNNNKWDNGSVGNFWHDYIGVDANDDGIGDTPYNISGSASNNDYYPIWEDVDDIPIVIITAPDEGDLLGIIAPTFNIEIEDSKLNKTWYYLDNGTYATINILFIYLINTSILQSVWEQFQEGNITIWFYANDTNGNIGFKNVTVRKLIDLINPNITGLEDDFSILQGSNASFSWKIIEDNPDYYELYLNGTLIKTDSYSNDTEIFYSFLNWTIGDLLFEITAYDTSGNNTSDSLLISIINRTDDYIFMEPNKTNTIDLITVSGLYIEYLSDSITFLTVERKISIFSGILKVWGNLTPYYFYNFTVFDANFTKNDSLVKSLLIRFYYDPAVIKDPNNLYILHYLWRGGSIWVWEAEQITLNIAGNYIEFTTTELSIFCLAEIEFNDGIPPFIAFLLDNLLIIIILSVAGVSIPSAYVITSRKKKKEIGDKLKHKKSFDKLPNKVKEDAYKLYLEKKAQEKKAVLLKRTWKPKKSDQKITTQIQKDYLIKSIENKNLIEKLSQLNDVNITALSEDFHDKIDTIQWDDNEKEEFIKEMLSLTPNKREILLNKLRQTQDIKKSENQRWKPEELQEIPKSNELDLETTNLQKLIKESNILEKLSQLDDVDITVVSDDFFEEIEQLEWEENEKQIFIREMLSLSPKERDAILDKLKEK